MKKLLLVFLTSFFCISANAGCDTKSLKGEYGFGVMTTTSQQTCAAIGTILFNKGVAVATAMTGCGASAAFQSLTGSYELGEYCVGQINFTDGSTAHFVLNKKLLGGQFFMSQNKALAFGSIFKQ
jgi:hypothetical protein